MISVGVLIDLYRSARSGGQVRCWEHFARAAAALPDQLDLTLHFLGDRDAVQPQAGNVRFVSHRPVFSTDRLRFLDQLPSTDLARYNRTLVPFLRGYDVLHTTHPHFTFGRTALRHAIETGTPLTSSVQTDVPRYTRIYIEHLVERWAGRGKLGHLITDKYGLGQRREAAMLARLREYWCHCQHVFVSRAEDYDQVAEVLPPDQISFLRRGITRDRFHPALRDRARLADRYRIPPDVQLLMFVGRLDDCKNCMTCARVARLLLDRGFEIHAMFVGEGPRAEEIRALLGESVTLPGILSQTELAWLYASADLFLFPSTTETFGNAVVEARASGLPVIVSAHGGSGERVSQPGIDGCCVSAEDPRHWADAAAELLRDPARMRAMGEAACAQVETMPDWREVLEEDLLPAWLATGRYATTRRVSASSVAREATGRF